MKKKRLFAVVATASMLSFSSLHAAEEVPCCPPPQGLEECCGGQIINPTNTRAVMFTIDITALFDKAKNAVSSLQANGSGCGWKDTGALTVSTSLEAHDECCGQPNNPQPKTIFKGTGSGDFNLGTWRCRWNALGAFYPAIPYWAAQIYAEATASFYINLGNISVETSCESPKVCHGPVSGNVALSAGLGGEVGNGYIQLECTGSGAGRLGTKICFESGAGFGLDGPFAGVDSLSAQCTYDIGQASFTLISVDLLALGN
jgi:hypothetical protein